MKSLTENPEPKDAPRRLQTQSTAPAELRVQGEVSWSAFLDKLESYCASRGWKLERSSDAAGSVAAISVRDAMAPTDECSISANGSTSIRTSTLNHHVMRFLASKHTDSTRTWYEKNLRPMVAFMGDEQPVDSVDRWIAESYWQKVRSRGTCWSTHPHRPTEERPLSVTTINNHLRAARTFWSEMVRQGVVDFNPFDHLKPMRDSRPVEMKAISQTDLLAIWQAAKRSGRRDLAIITILGTTGVRAGELVSMDIDRLDLKDGRCWVHGKRGWRKLLLGTMGVQAIKSYLAVRRETPTDRLWLNAYGQPLTTDGVRQIVDRLANEAGVAGRHNLHAFRHRTAQAWLDKGINAEIVAQLLGHADVSTTLQIYANQDETRLRAAMRDVEFSPFEDLHDTVDSFREVFETD